jgi:hypothetical protein
LTRLLGYSWLIIIPRELGLPMSVPSSSTTGSSAAGSGPRVGNGAPLPGGPPAFDPGRYLNRDHDEELLLLLAEYTPVDPALEEGDLRFAFRAGQHLRARWCVNGAAREALVLEEFRRGVTNSFYGPGGARWTPGIASRILAHRGLQRLDADEEERSRTQLLGDEAPGRATSIGPPSRLSVHAGAAAGCQYVLLVCGSCRGRQFSQCDRGDVRCAQYVPRLRVYPARDAGAILKAPAPVPPPVNFARVVAEAADAWERRGRQPPVEEDLDPAVPVIVEDADEEDEESEPPRLRRRTRDRSRSRHNDRY